MPHGFQNRCITGESPDYVIHRTGSDSLVISFSGMGIAGDGKPVYAFSGLSNRYGVNQILLRDQFQVWFLNGVMGASTNVATTVSFLRELIVDINPSRTLTIGSSAGGFSAMLYGSLLGVDRVIAINPQTLLKRGVECVAHGNLYLLKWCDQGEKRYHDLRKLKMAPTEIIYGEEDHIDMFHSGRMAGRHNITLLPVPGNHSTAAIGARDSGLLADVIEHHLNA